MKLPTREFTTVHAEPGERPLWIGLFGPSGGGKTYTALRVATGIRAVLGGRINLIDTDSGRGLHYADCFDYDYTPFPPPHGSLDYLVAINHAVRKQSARIVIIDSLSHEHEGEGGMIEFQEKELDRMAGDDYAKRERMKMLAWAAPKAARKALLRGMLAYGTGVVFILCFRADEQSKPVKKADENGKQKTEVVQMGFMPIAGKPFVYEATVCALLMPAANGVPTWNPENVGEKMMKKLPEQFKAMFERTAGQPLGEEHGRLLAEWAKGGPNRPATAQTTGKTGLTLADRAETAIKAILAKNTPAGVNQAFKAADALLRELEDAQEGGLIDKMTAAKDERLRELEAAK